MTERRPRRRWYARCGTAVGAILLLAGAAGMSTASAPPVRAETTASPDQVGQWTPPFEEHGATPRCARGSDGRIACKPDGAYEGVLRDGRVLYWNAIESDENVQVAAGAELSPETRNSSSRVLDLRNGAPSWFSPAHVDGGGRNPNIRAGDQCQGSDPMGIAGVPGRPGDGFVGSLLGGSGTGTATGIEHNPTCSPDRPAAQNNSGDMFCSDMANMANGEIISVGGTDWYNEPGDGIDRDHGYPYDFGAVELEGLRNARIFNPATSDWVEAAPMKYGRWYPSLVVLGDGRIVVAGGVTKLIKSTQLGQVRRTETFDPATNTWTENYVGSESENELPLMARLHLMPDGRIFYGGSGQMWGPAGEAIDEPLMALMQFFDPSTKKWSVVGPNPIPGRSGDYSIMLPLRPPYDTVHLLAYGGTVGVPPGGELATPFTQLYRIHGDSVDVQRGPDMHHARWFNAGVMLPTGKVLALNGADKDEVIDPGSEIPVHQTDLYDPETNTWTEMAPEARDRTYHNSAVLLPDGRVLSGGHSPIPAHYGHHGDVIPGVTANNNKDSSFQIWSPPYLFYGVPRPHISYAPSAVTWGQHMTVRVDDASSVDKVVLYRSPTSQHVLSNNNRMIELPFSKGADNHTLTATVPGNPNVATPGPYMIFVDRTSPRGEVPSVAAMTMVGHTSDSSPALIPMQDSTTGAGIGASPPGPSGPQQASSVPGNPPVPSARPGVSYLSEFVSVPPALTARLAAFLRQEGAGQPVAVVALLTALGLGLGIRARRWLIRHSRD
jgi:Galactose oxidase-like, Early set domain